MNVLIVDDEYVRIPAIAQWVNERYGGKCNVTHLTYVPITFEGFDVVFLDHDLGIEGNVYDALRNRSMDDFIGKVVIHSMNPVGAQNLARLFPFPTVRPYSAILKDIS